MVAWLIGYNRDLVATIGDTEVICECHIVPGSRGDRDTPPEGTEIDILAVRLDSRVLKISDKTYEMLYDQLYENNPEI